ncbi:helix-turn-helix domain-containing protein [Curtobacterium sp. JUb34]|uniref:helix-turn-helix domain-containing protein n=1 Tax=Curtobacterium sp. JUb34 TaxID=2485109 RepID=UPI000F46D4F5|nr:helix-turn-helix domain-containing protein [Curtobacterium sp. JUb34]
MGSLTVLSKTLFGNDHLLDIAWAVASGAREFDSPRVQKTTGLAPSTVHRTLRKLEEVDLVRRISSSVVERVQRYERLPHPMWKAVEVFVTAAEGKVDDADRRGAAARTSDG